MSPEMIPSLYQLVKDWLPTQRSRAKWDVIPGPWGRYELEVECFKFIGLIGEFADDGIDISARPRVDRQKLQAADPQFFEKLRHIMDTVEDLYKEDDMMIEKDDVMIPESKNKKFWIIISFIIAGVVGGGVAYLILWALDMLPYGH